MEHKPEPPERWWDLSAAALLSMALLTAASRLVATQWTDHLELAQTITLLGLLAGFALGKSRFSPRLVGILALAYGVFSVPWLIGTLYEPSVSWPERIQSIFGRISIILGQIARQETVFDSLLFLFLMVALFWVLSVHASYTIVRYGQPWQAIFPAGIALLIIHAFDAFINRRAWYLAIYLFFALVLVARLTYLQRFSSWQKSHTSLPPHLSLDFIRTTIVAAAILVAFAWTAPALAESFPTAERVLDTIKQPYNALRDRLDNAFASLRSSVGIVTTYYGDSVFLGRGNTLSDQQIMEVGVPVDLPSNVRLYWRARAYDRYQNGQWISSITNTAPFNPESDNLIHEASAARFPAVFEFSTALPLSTIYTPSQPNWVSRPAILHGEIQTGATIDLSGVRAEPGIAAGETYVVQASPPNVTISQLRNAGTEYPEWIRARYLQLPDTITDRTRAKAREITAGLDNPYDITSAITDWLRNNITYSETIPSPPDDQDVVDWFLFDLQQGFCNYYATAEVILLRSLGIPARWVVGYAQGEEQIEPRYIVRQRDAHAWPEVYFPGFGWVEFEPTASQPAIARLVGEVDPNDPNRGAFPGDAPTLEEELRQLREEREQNSVDPNNPALTQGDYVSIFLSIAAALLLVFLGMRFFLPPFPVMLVAVWQRLGLQPPQRLIFWAEQASARAAARIKLPPLPILVETSILKVGARPPAFIQRWSQMAQLPALSHSYLEINQALKRIGRPGSETETPLERANTLGAALPAADQPAHELVNEYQLSLFSTQPPNEDTAYQAGQVIRKLSLRKMYRNWLTRLQESPRSRRRSLFDPSERDEPPEKTFEI